MMTATGKGGQKDTARAWRHPFPLSFSTPASSIPLYRSAPIPVDRPLVSVTLGPSGLQSIERLHSFSADVAYGRPETCPLGSTALSFSLPKSAKEEGGR